MRPALAPRGHACKGVTGRYGTTGCFALWDMERCKVGDAAPSVMLAEANMQQTGRALQLEASIEIASTELCSSVRHYAGACWQTLAPGKG